MQQVLKSAVDIKKRSLILGVLALVILAMAGFWLKVCFAKVKVFYIPMTLLVGFRKSPPKKVITFTLIVQRQDF